MKLKFKKLQTFALILFIFFIPLLTRAVQNIKHDLNTNHDNSLETFSSAIIDASFFWSNIIKVSVDRIDTVVHDIISQSATRFEVGDVFSQLPTLESKINVAQATEAVDGFLGRTANYIGDSLGNLFKNVDSGTPIVFGGEQSGGIISDNENLIIEKSKFDFIRKETGGGIDSGYSKAGSQSSTQIADTKTIIQPTERIIERAVLPSSVTRPLVSSLGFYTREEVDGILQGYNQTTRSELLSLINNLNLTSNTRYQANTAAIGLTSVINNLSNTTATNLTVSGVTGLTDSDIPDNITISGYLPLTGGNITGNLGVGTTSPYAPLSVNGQVVASYFTTSSSTATSTFAYGVNLLGGCFAVNGICVSGVSWATTSANYFTSSSSTIPKTYTENVFTASTTFSEQINMNSASATSLTVSGDTNLATLTVGTTTAANIAITNTSTSTFTGPITTEALTMTGSGTSTFSNILITNNSELGTVLTGTWNGSAIGIDYGGTGLSSAPTYGQLLMGDSSGVYTLVSTSSLGITGTFSTTSADYWEAQQTRWATTSANYFTSSSSTIPKTYTENVFTASTTFSEQINMNSASATSLTVSGDTNLGTILSGVWNGTVVGALFGGTGINSYTEGDILYASGANTLSVLASGGEGTVLKISSGIPTWSTDLVGAGGSGVSPWATSTDNLSLYPVDTGDVVLVGASATSTTGNIFEVAGNTKLGGNLLITGSTTLQNFSGVNASTSQFSVTGSTWLGTITGPLQAINGLVSATSTMSIVYGGTGLSSAPTYGQLLMGDSSGAYTLVSTSSLGITGVADGSFSTTSADHWLSLFDKGYFFSTTSADHWLSLFDKGYFFSTTSSDYNFAVNLAATTTDALAQGSTNLYYSNSLVNSYINSSTTIPKAYSANNFTALNTFTNATATQFSVTGSTWLGTITGPLQAINGLVSATSTMSIVYGGTGLSSAPTYGQLLMGDSSGAYTLVSTSSLGLGVSAAGDTGQVQFNTGDAFNADSNLFWDNTNKLFGVGTSTPEARLHVSDTLSPLAIFDSIDNTNDAQILTRRANGTPGSPSAVTANQSIGFYGFNGYGATGFGLNATAYMRGIAAENFTDSAKGTHLAFGTASSSLSAATERMRITDTGLVGIGTTSPLRNLDAKGSWGGNSVVSSQTQTNDSTVIISTSALTYYLANNSGTTDLSVTTTFNLTGLPDVEGTYAFVELKAEKGVTTNRRTQTVVLSINGTSVTHLATASSTLAVSSTKNFTVIRLNSTWKVIGASGDGSGGISTESAKIVNKKIDQTVNNSTTLIGDGELYYGVDANQTWSSFWSIQVLSAVGNSGFKFSITAPSGATCDINYTKFPATSGSGEGGMACGAVSSGITMGNTAPETIFITANIVNGSTAGAVRLNWAQSSSKTANTTVQIGSFLQAFLASGADLAETYYSLNSGITSGDLVAIDGSIKTGVKMSTKAYDPNLIGVVTTMPGMVLGSGEWPSGTKPVHVALTGRVPVKVTTENGEIRAGDYLTSSSIPGVAMRATKSGTVIGQALSEYSGDGVGVVTVFIKNANYNGTSFASVFGGLMLEGISLGEIDYQKSILSQLLSQSTSTTNSSEIFTDRIAATQGIVSPTITTKDLFAETISANKIVGLEFITDRISSLTSDVVKVASSSVSMSDILGKIETSDIKTNDLSVFNSLSVGGNLSVLGSSEFGGDVLFASTTSIKRLLVEEIHSPVLDELSSGLTILSDKLIDIASSTDANTNKINNFASTTESILARLSAVEEKPYLDLSSVLNLESGLTINSLTLLKGGLKVDQIGAIGDVVDIMSDINFIGRPYLNNDSGGFAIISSGDRIVEVTFDREYVNEPIVNATISTSDSYDSSNVESIFGNDIRFILTNKTTKGFTIATNKPVSIETRFSWIALAIKDSKTFASRTVHPSKDTNQIQANISGIVSASTSSSTLNLEISTSSNNIQFADSIPLSNSNSSTPIKTEENSTPTTPVVDTDMVDTDTTIETPEEVVEEIIETVEVPVAENQDTLDLLDEVVVEPLLTEDVVLDIVETQDEDAAIDTSEVVVENMTD